MTSYKQGTSSGTQGNYEDHIDGLPTDETVPSHSEINIVETLFKKKLTTVQKLLSGAKETVLLGILFVIFSIPPIDALLRRFITAAESPYILIAIKAVLFVAVYFIIKNVYLARKK